MRKSPPRRSLMKSTLVSAACMSAACVSAPAPRPVLPTECPPGSAETLRRFGVEENAVLRGVLVPIREATESKTKKLTVREGPWTAFLLIREGEIPPDSKFKGVLYLKNGLLHGRFTRLQLRDSNEEHPVCLQLSSGRGLGHDLEPESRPGKPVVDIFPYLYEMDGFN